VGYDLLASEWDSENLAGYRDVLQRLVDRAAQDRGQINVVGRINSQEHNDELHLHLQLKGADIHLEREGYSALAKTFERLADDESFDFIEGMRLEVIEECEAHALPVPPAISGFFDSWIEAGEGEYNDEDLDNEDSDESTAE